MVSAVSASEVLSRLDPEERRWVEEFRERIREALGPHLRDLRVFGSKVRGDDRDESDIDLLVLVDEKERELAGQVVDIAMGISALLSPVVFDFDAYHSPKSRASGFYEEMRRDSVRL